MISSFHRSIWRMRSISRIKKSRSFWRRSRLKMRRSGDWRAQTTSIMWSRLRTERQRRHWRRNWNCRLLSRTSFLSRPHRYNCSVQVHERKLLLKKISLLNDQVNILKDRNAWAGSLHITELISILLYPVNSVGPYWSVILFQSTMIVISYHKMVITVHFLKLFFYLWNKLLLVLICLFTQ